MEEDSMDPEIVKALKEMKMRASYVIKFCDKALAQKATDDDMNMLRGHCKGITFTASMVLRSQQQEWYKLSEEDRSKAVRDAFQRKKEAAQNRPGDKAA
jgi:hypothetical protein